VVLPVLHERVVVRGEERAALEALRQELHDGVGDGRAVEGGGACWWWWLLWWLGEGDSVDAHHHIWDPRPHSTEQKGEGSNAPRPNSSRMTRERGVACCSILEASHSSTISVDCPCRIRSEAPTLRVCMVLVLVLGCRCLVVGVRRW
jgi:hypothetical protein